MGERKEKKPLALVRAGLVSRCFRNLSVCSYILFEAAIRYPDMILLATPYPADDVSVKVR